MAWRFYYRVDGHRHDAPGKTYTFFPLTNTESAIHCWVRYFLYFTNNDRIGHSDSKGTDGKFIFA